MWCRDSDTAAILFLFRIHFEALASDNDALANVDEDHVTQVSRLSQIALTQ